MAQRTGRILIVEDQPIVGMELELALADAGHDVVGVAVDRRQALRLGEERRPELALVDVNLADGRTGVQAALTLTRDFGVTVLFLTAEPASIPPGLAGALGVVVKPCSPEGVQAAIGWALSVRAGADPPAPAEVTPAPRTPDTRP